jgi:glycosyltransferase involved in cell wall biosynthesis
MSFALLLAALLALVAVVALVQLWWGHMHIPALADVPPARPGAPRVSIVVAARNEERHVEAAVRGLLAQDYPDLELIVVDDRSTDATSDIVRQLAAADARLRVVRVESLPDGWLGKNHALHLGARDATGALVLFTDADVMLQPDAVARAVRLMELTRADHLAVAPSLVVPTWPLALVVNYFMMWFLLYLKPWRAPDPRSRAFIGIGAFNLVRASAFRAVGGFSRIPLRPDDDIMLGKLLKQGGHRQLLAVGDGIVSVEWYRTLGEMARGFRKNAFAGLHYSVALVAGTVAGNVLLCVWPFIAVFLRDGPERWSYAVAALAQMVAYGAAPLARRERPWIVLLYPVASLLFVGILVAAVARTLRRGGIEWRDTFYPLAALRANRV